MIDHISLRVRDLQSSKRFYQAALAPLGYAVMMEFPDAVGLGAGGKADFWLTTGAPGATSHVAFRCRTTDEVSRFHSAALAAGARDNGAPGLRTHYHPNYFGGFVYDLDGNNVEAVCHGMMKAALKGGAKKAEAARKPKPAAMARSRKPVAKKAKKTRRR